MVIYYVPWYPCYKEPPYWKYCRVDGVLIPIKMIKGAFLDKVTTYGLRKVIDFDGKIFLDSLLLTFNLFKRKYRFTLSDALFQEHVLNVFSWLDADFIAHLDKPYFYKDKLNDEEKWEMLKATINNAYIAYKIAKSLDIKVVYVVQGWDLESTKLCAKKLKGLGEYYGLGSSSRRPLSYTLKRIELLKKILGKDIKLHIFGVSSVSFLNVLKNPEVNSIVMSFDSSVPIKAAIAGHVLLLNTYEKAMVRVHINDLIVRDELIELLRKCSCTVCSSKKYLSLLADRGREGRLARTLHNIQTFYDFCKLIFEDRHSVRY